MLVLLHVFKSCAVLGAFNKISGLLYLGVFRFRKVVLRNAFLRCNRVVLLL
jgi:hypothetical protein